MTVLAHRQPVAFITISSRDGLGMVKPVPLAVAEVIVFFLATQWLVHLALMIRELAIIWLRLSSLIVIYDVPWSYVWLALRSDWSWLWA